MIANFLSLNEITKKYQVIFNSGNENNFRVHIWDKIIKFIANDNGIYHSKPDNIGFKEIGQIEKKNII